MLRMFRSHCSHRLFFLFDVSFSRFFFSFHHPSASLAHWQVPMASKGVIEALVGLMHRHPRHEYIQRSGVGALNCFSEASELRVCRRVGRKYQSLF